MKNCLFFESLQVALGNRACLSVSPTDEQWEDIVRISKAQSLVGVVYQAMHKLKEKGYDIDEDSFLKQLRRTENCRIRNDELDVECRVLTKKFAKSGFDACILKGQGVNLYYDKDIVRQPGDIDIWVCPKEGNFSLNKRREIVRNFCVSLVGEQATVYHHMNFPVRENSVEVHFTPTWMNSPFRNKKLQQFFDEQWDRRELCEKGFFVPSVEFNEVYALVHMLRHLLDEGVGLRQFMDYYFTLKVSHKKGLTHHDPTLQVIHSLGLDRFAAAVMYVMKEAFAMPSEFLLCPLDEKAGRFLLNEVMISGNFGMLDNRYGKKREVGGMTLGIHNLWVQTRHNIKYLRYFPSETLWNIPFRIWHYFWRKKRGWR